METWLSSFPIAQSCITDPSGCCCGCCDRGVRPAGLAVEDESFVFCLVAGLVVVLGVVEILPLLAFRLRLPDLRNGGAPVRVGVVGLVGTVELEM